MNPLHVLMLRMSVYSVHASIVYAGVGYGGGAGTDLFITNQPTNLLYHLAAATGAPACPGFSQLLASPSFWNKVEGVLNNAECRSQAGRRDATAVFDHVPRCDHGTEAGVGIEGTLLSRPALEKHRRTAGVCAGAARWLDHGRRPRHGSNVLLPRSDNEATGHCQWEPPQPQQQDLPAGWTAGVAQDTGATYYCHEATGTCQWELPQQESTTTHLAPAGRGAQGQKSNGAQALWRLNGAAFRNAMNEPSGVAGFTGVAGFVGADKSFDYELDFAALPYTLCEGDVV